ncbi:MAG: glutamate-cysteine ligase family protein [Candidatus Jordarchaeales archaeon]
MHKLPFTQGIEMEVQVVDSKGRLLRGATLIQVWKHLMGNALKNLQKAVADAPAEVSDNVINVSFSEKERRGKRLPYVVVSYRTPRGAADVDVLGPDPNVSQITWILELVTPPCRFMEELEWWIKTLYSVAYDSLPSGYHLISIGFNPFEEEYRSGVTFGDHYHVGVSKEEAPAVYNMIRAFVPHLIALTVNSPFIREGVTGTVKVQRKGKVFIIGKDCVRDIRLKYNTSQMGPADKDHYIPYLESLDRRAFDSVVMREPPDDRYVDVFPFTDYGTIEVRVFDSQFSAARRLALVALLQALALKAVKLASKGVRVPRVSSSVVVENREKAILYGLMGKFFPDKGLKEKEASFYNTSPSGEPYSKLFEAVRGMLKYVEEEVDELGFQDYLKPFLVSVYGSDKLEPPCSPADYLLYLYSSSGGDMGVVARSLMEITRKYCTGPGDPLIEAFGEARVESVEKPKLAVKVSMKAETTASMVVAEEIIPFTVEVSSDGDAQATLVAKVTFADESETIQTAVKKIFLRKGKTVIVTSSQLPLKIPLKAFHGTKTCRLKFALKGEGVGGCEAETRTFKAAAIPNVKVTVGTTPKTVRVGETRELKVKVESRPPEFRGEYKLVVTAEKGGKISPILTKKINIPAVVSVPIPSGEEGEYTLRFQVLYMGETVAEYKTPVVRVERPSVAAVETKTTATRQELVAQTAEAKKKEAVTIREAEAKPKVIVVTRLTPPTAQVRREAQVSVAKPKTPVVQDRTKAERAVKTAKQSKLTRIQPSSRRRVERAESKTAVAAAHVSRAIDVSHISLRPRLSVSGSVSKHVVKWGETCKAVFEVVNLNPDVAGPFFAEIFLEGRERRLMDYRELVVKQSKRLSCKVKVGKDVTEGSFAFVCRVVHGEEVLAECKTGVVHVTALPPKKAVKVSGIECPKNVAASSTIVVKLKVRVEGVMKPVKLSVSLTAGSVTSKEYVVDEGMHVLPLTVKAWEEKGRHKLKISLEADGARVYSEEVEVNVTPRPPITISEVTLRVRDVQAGGQVAYEFEAENAAERQVKARGVVRLFTLQGEVEVEEKLSLELKPRKGVKVHGKIEIPPWLAGKKTYLQAMLQFKTQEGSFVLTETSPMFMVSPPTSPLVKVAFTKLPSMLEERKESKLAFNVKKKVAQPIKVVLTARVLTKTRKVWSGEIKQQEKTVSVAWKPPQVPNTTIVTLEALVYVKDKLLPSEVVQTPRHEVKLVKVFDSAN